MATALLTHPACLDHATPDGHPERVDRLRAVLAALETETFQDLLRIEAPAVDEAAILRAHAPEHVEAVKSQIPTSGAAPIDADTWVSPHSWTAAERAAGAVVEAVDIVMRGEARNAFCAVRPPGHHAEHDRAMGFCLLNNAAIGAHHALAVHGLARVAVVDFDVHHGNGVQDIFERDGRLFYASTHEWPLYPGTGAPHETGVGNIVNVCLPALSGSVEFREAFAGQILPPLERFRPDLLIISAGFDAHGDDPLAQLLLNESDFVWATERLCAVAAKLCQGRVVSTLEGGYDLHGLSRSTAAHVEALMRCAQL
ncbi:MAG: histone deacetylase family protein [Pseudomonadota bacterium]